jgi:hypothetical protein
MIIVRLMGGLGNQMFQYSVGRHLALLHGRQLILDTSWYQQVELRKFSLQPFGIDAKVCDEGLKTIEMRACRLVCRALAKINRYGLYRAGPYCAYSGLAFRKEILELPDGSYLDGYWQSEKYFLGSEATIRREFTAPELLTHGAKRLKETMETCQAVSVHIRRGDYVSDPASSAYHAVCDNSYYQRAVEVLSQRVGNPKFFIFSDEPNWVEHNLVLPGNLTFAHKYGSFSAHEDMLLMSTCSHHIIANSTFSWWGAWLNPSPEKIVIAPQRWFANSDANRRVRELIPEGWIKI